MDIPIYHLAECASTMDAAREMRGTTPPFIVTTDFQTRGRGRLPSRPWHAAAGENLLFTYVFPVAGFAALKPALPLRAGLALRRALLSLTPLAENDIAIKWPNDIMVRGKKVSGILAECDGSRVFLGMGVNLAQKDFSAAPRGTSLLRECGSSPEARSLLEAIIAFLHEDIQEGKVDWLSALNAALYLKGTSVAFEYGASGSNNIVAGTLAGVDTSGALVVSGADGVSRSYLTGELRLE